MARAEFAVEFPELRQLQKDLQQYTGHVAKKYLRSAVRASLKPGVAALKQTTPRGPTGNLRRAVTSKVVIYRSRTAVGLVGYRVGGAGSKPGKGSVRKGNNLGYHQGFVEFGTKNRRTKGRIASSFNRLGPFTMAKSSKTGGRVQTKPKYPKAFFKAAPAGQTVNLGRMPIGGSTGVSPVKAAYRQSIGAIRGLISKEAARALENAAKDKFAHYRPKQG
jgi:hypothetical protein